MGVDSAFALFPPSLYSIGMSKKTDGSINIRISKDTHKIVRKYAKKMEHSSDWVIREGIKLAALFGGWNTEPKNTATILGQVDQSMVKNI